MFDTIAPSFVRPPHRLYYLDGWRGLAILAVLVGHFASNLGAAGGLGVDLFFVLSGRLMAQILVKEEYPYKAFFIRRVTRIYPALLVFATAMLIVSLIAKVAGVKSDSFISPLDYIAAITMWMNYKVAFIGEAGAVDHLWSISVEEHCYIILAILCMVTFRKRRLVALLAALVASAALLNGVRLQTFTNGSEHEIFWRTDVRLAPLFASFAFALVDIKMRKAFGWLSLPLLIAGCVVPFTSVTPAFQLLLTTVLLALSVNSLDYSPRFVRSSFEWEWLRYLGVTSYSLYLWQQPFYRVHEKASVYILLPLAFVAALASYYLVEGPGRELLNKRFAPAKD